MCPSAVVVNILPCFSFHSAICFSVAAPLSFVSFSMIFVFFLNLKSLIAYSLSLIAYSLLLIAYSLSLTAYSLRPKTARLREKHDKNSRFSLAGVGVYPFICLRYMKGRVISWNLSPCFISLGSSVNCTPRSVSVVIGVPCDGLP